VAGVPVSEAGGYARSALALLVGYAASIGVTRLEAHIAPDNHASRHVAEAAGFTQADTVPDGDGTEYIRYTRDASGDEKPPAKIDYSKCLSF
jgi:RimJ/RimL family protein N-acetyltransferase